MREHGLNMKYYERLWYSQWWLMSSCHFNPSSLLIPFAEWVYSFTYLTVQRGTHWALQYTAVQLQTSQMTQHSVRGWKWINQSSGSLIDIAASLNPIFPLSQSVTLFSFIQQSRVKASLNCNLTKLLLRQQIGSVNQVKEEQHLVCIAFEWVL